MRSVGSQSTLWGLMEVELRWCPLLLYLHGEVSSLLSQTGEITWHQKPIPRHHFLSWADAVSNCWRGSWQRCLPITEPLNYTRQDAEEMMFTSTEIITSWRPVCVRWQEPVPSSSARFSLLSLWDSEKGFCCALLLLCPFNCAFLPDTYLKQQPPLTGLQSIHPSPAFV